MGLMDHERSSDNNTAATSGALFEIFQLLSDKIDEKHANTRDAINHAMERIEIRMDLHDREDRLVADRVLKIETVHTAEQAELSREKSRVYRETDARVARVALIVSSVVAATPWIVNLVIKLLKG